MERWVGGVRHQLLDRILVINAAHLRKVLRVRVPFQRASAASGVGSSQSAAGHSPTPSTCTARSSDATGSAASSTNTPMSHEVPQFLGQRQGSLCWAPGRGRGLAKRCGVRNPFRRSAVAESLLLHAPWHVARHGEHEPHRLVTGIPGGAEHARAPALDHGDAMLAAVLSG